MSGSPIERARLLLQSGRNEDALEELGRALAVDPTDAEAHGLRALALMDLKRLPEALESAQQAAGEDPEDAFGHRVLGWVLLRMQKPKPALASAEEALSIDPEDEGLYALQASCLVTLRRWDEGLVAAEAGLEIDPDDVQLTNLRALCLRQLGQRDEAADALRTSLGVDPENAWTHESLGWAAIHEGNKDEAIQHFKEALRLDPSDEGARTGLATALKARIPLYRPIIAWQLFCSRISERFGVMLVVGFFALHYGIQQVLPEGSPLGTVLLVAYGTVVWMSWVGNALFDLMLLSRASLRPILSGKETLASAGVLLCVLLAVASLGLHFYTGSPVEDDVAIAAAFAAIPTAGWVNLANGRAQLVGGLLAVAAFALVLVALAADLSVANWLGMDFRKELGVDEEFHRMGSRLEWASQAAGISMLVSVGSSWVLTGLGFVPESLGTRGTRRRPG